MDSRTSSRCRMEGIQHPTCSTRLSSSVADLPRAPQTYVHTFFSSVRPPPRTTLFPYTTLFRSDRLRLLHAKPAQGPERAGDRDRIALVHRRVDTLAVD